MGHPKCSTTWFDTNLNKTHNWIESVHAAPHTKEKKNLKNPYRMVKMTNFGPTVEGVRIISWTRKSSDK